MALLASIVPVMSQTSCVSVLSLLFETAGVALENTPGLNEFEKIRDALLPLVRETDFKEMVLHYHYLLQALDDSNCLDNSGPYDAIPHDKDIPKINSYAIQDRLQAKLYYDIQWHVWSWMGSRICFIHIEPGNLCHQCFRSYTAYKWQLQRRKGYASCIFGGSLSWE